MSQVHIELIQEVFPDLKTEPQIRHYLLQSIPESKGVSDNDSLQRLILLWQECNLGTDHVKEFNRLNHVRQLTQESKREMTDILDDLDKLSVHDVTWHGKWVYYDQEGFRGEEIGELISCIPEEPVIQPEEQATPVEEQLPEESSDGEWSLDNYDSSAEYSLSDTSDESVIGQSNEQVPNVLDWATSTTPKTTVLDWI